MEAANLILKVDSTGAKRATTDLDNLTRAGGRAEQQTGVLTGAWKALTAVAASAALGQAVSVYIKMADATANMDARLRLATKSQRDFEQAQKDTFAIAQRTSVELDSVVGLYGRLSQSSTELGLSQKEVTQLTETIGQAFQVSGANAQESAGSIRQLTQAMAGGTLRAEEFNSIIENSPRIVQALADHMGVSFGKVRQLVNDGKISSEEFAKALLAASESVQHDFDQMPMTVSRATQKVQNALFGMVADAEKASGATNGLAGAIDDLATTLQSEEVHNGFSQTINAVVQLTDLAGRATGAVVTLGGAVRDSARYWEDLMRKGTGTAGNNSGLFGVGDYLREKAPWLYQNLGDPAPGAAKPTATSHMGIDFTRPAPADGVGAGGVSAELQKEIDKIKEQAAAYGLSRVALARLNQEKALAAASNDAERDAIRGAYGELIKRIQATDFTTKSVKELTKADKEWLEWEKEILAHEEFANEVRREHTNAKWQRSNAREDAAERASQAVGDYIADLEFEASLYGKSRLEQEQMIAVRYAGAAATDKQKEAIRGWVAENERLRESQQNWDELQGSMSRGLYDIVSGAESATSALKGFFDQLNAQILSNITDDWAEGITGWLKNIGKGSGGSSGGGWVSGIMGALGFGGQKAAGGPVMAGKGYIVGDGGGPELFFPQQSGTLQPIGAGSPGVRSGGAPMVVNMTVQGRIDRRTEGQIALAIAQKQRLAGGRS